MELTIVSGSITAIDDPVYLEALRQASIALMEDRASAALDSNTKLLLHLDAEPTVTTPLHGIEYEFQLVCEIKGVMQTVYVDLFSEHNLCIKPIRYSDYSRGMQPRNDRKIKADIGNIEISTEPYKTYKDAVLEAEDLLNSKVVPWLAKYLTSFALFLPAPMCILEKGDCPQFSNSTSCLKHWNIDNDTMKKFNNFFSYPYTIKEGISGARIEVKIPYHFTPPEDVSQMPDFKDIIIPPDKWRPLVGYYRSGKWHQIRPLR